jgi:putative ABC transport system permease protein
MPTHSASNATWATLFSALAGLALPLAALGVYGLVAQSDTQRRREMGIRLALGATKRSVIRAAAAPGIILTLSGPPRGFYSRCSPLVC